MPITLPTTLQPPTRTNPRLLIIYGPPKVGKSSVIAQLPDTLMVDTEEGSSFLTALKVKVNSLSELLDVLKQCEKARKTGQPLYKRIAIDTIDQIEDWCVEQATLDYKNSIIGGSFKGDSVLELPKGGGWRYMWEKFKDVKKAALLAADEVIFCGHVKDKMLVDKQLREVNATDLDLTGKLRNIACAGADAIGFVARPGDGRQLVITFRTSDLRNCGNRAAHLAGKEVVLGEQVDGKLVTYWERIYLNEPAPRTPENGTGAA